MGFPKVFFRIIESRQCPFYDYGDIFIVTGIAISIVNEEENAFITTTIAHTPAGKKTCKILIGDLTKIIMHYERGDKVPVCMISCSGCTGTIRLEHSRQEGLSLLEPADPPLNELASTLDLISDFGFFKNIEQKNLEKVVQFFRLTRYEKGAIVIRKGDPGGCFYIIISGSINVINEAGITISKLGKGDVFGEMSLICNENVSATIQIAEPTSILSIGRENFQKILEHYPAVQLYFSRLMAGRLNKSNLIRTEDLSSAMIGNLSEIPSEALFQTLNMNNKTGILTITELSRGTARFSFRQGSLIKAKYNDVSGEAAFYEILKEHKGRFRFTPGIPPEDFEVTEIGYFMKLLMEGMRRLDEGRTPKVN
ncbi:MAG: cyclic nucleotide-binding domain-containing protein [Desulfocapsaceae bacterium]|nr:cyclic nucleotide-binding domain-containing protein [Desulfocapsaceae bacterium]